jgi:SAM-dependent methyltransferase
MEESVVGSAAGEVGQHRAADAPSDPGVDVDPNAVYALGSSSGETARLQRQADELAPESSALLDRVGLRRGDSAIDLGCGPRGVLELLSDRVSPGGRVVGLDADAAHVAMASRFAADRGLSDVEIVCADARHTGLDAGSFDLVHARALLVTVPEPAEVLAEIFRLVRPGGWVVGWSPMVRSRSAIRLIRLSTGCASSCSWPFPVAAPTRAPGAVWASCTARQAWRTSAWK